MNYDPFILLFYSFLVTMGIPVLLAIFAIYYSYTHNNKTGGLF